MSMNLSSPQPLGPLSVGNVVSASFLRLYRDRFKLYYRLAFVSYLANISRSCLRELHTYLRSSTQSQMS